MKNWKFGPKYFTTIEDTICWMNNGLTKSEKYTLCKGLLYSTTNCQYLKNGDMYFQLYDEQGWIGDYVIYKQFLSNIKIDEEDETSVNTEKQTYIVDLT